MVSRGAAIHIKYAFGLAEILLFVLLTVVDAEIQSVEPVAARRSSDVGSSEVLLVDITVLRDAATKGAVCLDGSPPAYNLHRGFGSGANSWLINMEGGGWCNNVTSCLRRAHSHLGSSLYMGEKLVFSGILTNNQSLNPDFYNWNRVAVRYCDGSSFTGDVEEVNQVTKLRFRGQRIWQAVMEDLLAKGMDKAEQALLTGCSAGGLTTFLHCDEFRDLLPETAKVKCMPDAGFFIDEKDISGGRYIRSYFNEIVTLQGSSKNLPRACTTKMELDSSLCFFPQYLLQLIETPLFVLNAAYDSWQIKNILAPSEADPYNQWQLCKLNILNCTPSQLKVMQGGADHIGNGNLVDNFTLLSSLVKRFHTIGFTSEPTTPRPHLLIAATCSFRYDMLSALKPVRRSRTGGLFINSCYAHCQTNLQSLWHSPDSPRLNSKTIAEAVGDWFFNRTVVKDIDCPYPCDSTCHNRVFTS